MRNMKTKLAFSSPVRNENFQLELVDFSKTNYNFYWFFRKNKNKNKN